MPRTSGSSSTTRSRPQSAAGVAVGDRRRRFMLSLLAPCVSSLLTSATTTDRSGVDQHLEGDSESESRKYPSGHAACILATPGAKIVGMPLICRRPGWWLGRCTLRP